MKKGLIFLLILAAAVPMAGLQAQEEIGLSVDAPQVGQPLTITLAQPTDSLRITFRPNSSMVKTEVLVNNPPAAVFEWTPRDPGLVQLGYTDPESGAVVRRNVSVFFDGLSVSGLVVMISAGLILFGGAGLAFHTLFRDQEEDGTLDLDPAELPDT